MTNQSQSGKLKNSLFRYDVDGQLYPDYLRTGNASQHIIATAQHFCRGKGLDIGGGKWPFPGAIIVDQGLGFEHSSVVNLPDGYLDDGCWDFIFSSHCLEHLDDYVAALEHWRIKLRPGGCLFLYLPHPDMTYWRPEYCRKHRHQFLPAAMAETLRALGYRDVIHSERDLAWSFSVVGFR